MQKGRQFLLASQPHSGSDNRVRRLVGHLASDHGAAHGGFPDHLPDAVDRRVPPAGFRNHHGRSLSVDVDLGRRDRRRRHGGVRANVPTQFGVVGTHRYPDPGIVPARAQVAYRVESKRVAKLVSHHARQEFLGIVDDPGSAGDHVKQGADQTRKVIDGFVHLFSHAVVSELEERLRCLGSLRQCVVVETIRIGCQALVLGFALTLQLDPRLVGGPQNWVRRLNRGPYKGRADRGSGIGRPVRPRIGSPGAGRRRIERPIEDDPRIGVTKEAIVGRDLLRFGRHRPK